MHSHGSLFVSTSYFEKKTASNIQNDQRCNNIDRDIGFQVGLSPEGAWESFRSFLPLSTIAKTFKDEYVAAEVVMKNGKKHAIFRGLATITNDSDIRLDISVSKNSSLESHNQHRSIPGVFGAIDPGCSTILPWRCMFRDSSYCLHVRPCIDMNPYAWGYPVAVGAVNVWGKDQQSTDQAALFRQFGLKTESKMSASSLRLDQLEKNDMLFCSPGTAGKSFWMSVGMDASVLQTEVNTPVYDWKISVTSPLKMENRLPCPAEFTICERAKDGRSVERQHGVISSRGTEHIYYVDIRNPIYLTLYVHGGWVLEKVKSTILVYFYISFCRDFGNVSWVHISFVAYLLLQLCMTFTYLNSRMLFSFWILEAIIMHLHFGWLTRRGKGLGSKLLLTCFFSFFTSNVMTSG